MTSLQAELDEAQQMTTSSKAPSARKHMQPGPGLFRDAPRKLCGFTCSERCSEMSLFVHKSKFVRSFGVSSTRGLSSSTDSGRWRPNLPGGRVRVSPSFGKAWSNSVNIGQKVDEAW